VAVESIPPQAEAAEALQTRPLATIFADWCDLQERSLKEHAEGKDQLLSGLFPRELFKTEYELDRYLAVTEYSGAAVLAWCEQHNETVEELREKLGFVAWFCAKLYNALEPESPLDERQPRGGLFWRHRDGGILQPESKKEREDFFDKEGLKRAADQYLARSWLNNPYLDWVLTDALIAGSMVEAYEGHQGTFGGMAYALFAGHVLKTLAFKAVTIPLRFSLSWILPGFICWWLQPSTTAIVVAALYYLVNLGWLAFVLSLRALYWLRNGKSGRRESLDRVTSLARAYDELRDPTTIHVPSLQQAVGRAREGGVVWPPQLLCLLDTIVQKRPTTWQVPNVEGEYWDRDFGSNRWLKILSPNRTP
jgi:hypothetical protein